jgi:transcriptional regulator with XRE-family HTH domain
MDERSPGRGGRGPGTQNLGERVRALRQRNKWSLAQLAGRTGLAASTLSRIENNQLSLTYEKLLDLSRGFGVDLAELLRGEGPGEEVATGRRSYTPPDGGRVIETGAYLYRYLCTDMTRKKMTPIVGEISARNLAETGGYLRHEGEEVVYVLDGVMELHTEFYEPLRIETGGCAYFDSRMGHAFVAVEGPVKMLSVCTTEEPALVAVASERASRSSKPAPPRLG